MQNQILPTKALRAHFSEVLPGLQTAWDSTSLGDFKLCPRKYFLTQICNWRAKSTSHHLVFGIWFHAGPEFYGRRRAEGQDHEVALRATVRYVLEGTHGWASEDPKKNRESLIRSVVWYLEFYENDPLKTYILPNGKPALELSFRFNLDFTFGTGEPVLLCGHLDEVVELGNDLYISDRKTTGSALGSYFFDQFSPHNQMSLYTLAGKIVLERKVAGLVIDAAQIGAGFTRFARGFVQRTSPQIDEWMESTQALLRFAEQCARDGYWPQNDAACSQYGNCIFRQICSRDPSVRGAFLRASFDQIEWNPLSSRGGDEG